MSFEVEFDDKEVMAFLKKMSSNLSDVTNSRPRFMGLLSSLVNKDIMDHFDKEQGSEGPWKPWSKIYREHMEAKGKGGDKILQDTGRLRQGFIPSNYRVQSNGILWFNNVTAQGFPYALAHNDGVLGMPKRDFMWASEKLKTEIGEKTLQFILDNGS